ncbi:MAG: helix-turn-helix transcriptional regulator [Bacteroidetes bacterium]|nr:helix-turn-helix transcriptional regulator [Bacteroidota bacterium]
MKSNLYISENQPHTVYSNPTFLVNSIWDMGKEIYKIPDFIINDKPVVWPYIHYYSSDKIFSKNKVTSTQNLLCILLEGTKIIHEKYSVKELANSQLFLLAKGNILMSERPNENKIYKSILIFFDDAFLIDFCLKHKINFSDHKNDDSYFQIINKNEYLINYEKSLQNIESIKNAAFTKLKVEEILLFFYFKYRDVFLNFLKNTLSVNPTIRFKSVIEAYKNNNNIRIEELAFICNMSLSTFKRTFQKTFDLPPKQYFINVKMNRAAILLKSKRSPSEIYLDLGYQSLSSFSNEFKKYFGVYPKEFQNN